MSVIFVCLYQSGNSTLNFLCGPSPVTHSVYVFQVISASCPGYRDHLRLSTFPKLGQWKIFLGLVLAPLKKDCFLLLKPLR